VVTTPEILWRNARLPWSQLDPWKVMLPLTVTVGRSDPSAQPEANSCTFRMRGRWPVAGRGDEVAVVVLGRGRFRGTIAALKVTHADGRLVTEVTCVGRMVQAAGRGLPVVARPEQTERQRVESLIAANAPGAAYTSAEWGPTSPSTALRLRAETPKPDTEDTSLLEALREVAASTAAVIWEDPNGVIKYRSVRQREQPAYTATVTRFQILDGIDWEKPAGEPANTVRVVYGAEPKDTTFTGGTVGVLSTTEPGDLAGRSLGDLVEGGGWHGVPDGGAPPGLEGVPLWVQSVGDAAAGAGWQVVTSDAGAEVWHRTAGPAGWGPWVWLAGGLPPAVSRLAEVPAHELGDLPVESTTDRCGFGVVIVSPRPVRCRVGVRVEATITGHGDEARFGLQLGPWPEQRPGQRDRPTVQVLGRGPGEHASGAASASMVFRAGATTVDVGLQGVATGHPVDLAGATVWLEVVPESFDIDGWGY
jgi:hypothetical protein